MSNYFRNYGAPINQWGGAEELVIDTDVNVKQQMKQANDAINASIVKLDQQIMLRKDKLKELNSMQDMDPIIEDVNEKILRLEKSKQEAVTAQGITQTAVGQDPMGESGTGILEKTVGAIDSLATLAQKACTQDNALEVCGEDRRCGSTGFCEDYGWWDRPFWGGLPTWVWVLIFSVILLIVLILLAGGGGFFFGRRGTYDVY